MFKNKNTWQSTTVVDRIRNPPRRRNAEVEINTYSHPTLSHANCPVLPGWAQCNCK
jgi:hypothetical protein